MTSIISEPLRLNYVFDEILPSSATDTEQVINTVAALAQRGHHIVLSLPHLRGRPVPTASRLREYYQVQGSFEVTTMPTRMDRFRPLQKASHAWRASSLDAARHADAVYTRNLAALQSALARGYRVFYEHFRPWPDQYPPLVPWLRSMLRNPRCLGVVLHSEVARKSFESIGVPGEKLVVIHNGYSKQRVHPRLTTSEAREKLGLSSARPLAVYAGRVNEHKGLDSILNLAQHCPEIEFALVGSEGDGSVERAAGAIANVSVFPWQPFDKTLEYLYAADILMIPPSMAPLEQFGTTILPMKLFLYLASNRAIFAPAAADTAEILVDGRNACLVNPRDRNGTIEKFRHLATHAEFRAALAAQALKDAENLTWDARAQRLERFVRDQLERGEVPIGFEDRWDPSDWVMKTAQWTAQWTAQRTARWAAQRTAQWATRRTSERLRQAATSAKQ